MRKMVRPVVADEHRPVERRKRSRQRGHDRTGKPVGNGVTFTDFFGALLLHPLEADVTDEHDARDDRRQARAPE